MIEKSPDEQDPKFLAMLALATNATDPAEDCPPEDQLAAFIDGVLHGAARQAMLAHLDRCPACRQHWLEVADLVDADAAEPVKALSTGERWGSLVRQGIESLFSPWKLALASAAAAAIVGLAVVVSVAPDIGRQVDAQYAVKVDYAGELARLAQGMPLPWQSAALGFGETDASLPARAFGAGVWIGRAALVGGAQAQAPLPPPLAAPGAHPWPATAWSDYYQFGRWAVLLWAQLSAGQEIAQWADHRRVATALRAGLTERQDAEREAVDALGELRKIDTLLSALERDPASGAQDDLRRRLMMAIQQLAALAP